jgi:hypothetical protein
MNMKLAKAAFASTLILLAFVASDSAFARPGFHHGGGGVRFGLAVGIPIGLGFGYYGGYYPPYYPYYPPYYAPAVTVPYAAPTYIEQGSPQAGPATQNYWYYCADSKSYYPYVNQCASGWQRVSPTPPPG